MVEHVDVTVYYLEMLSHQQRDIPAPRDGLTVRHEQTPSVENYRFLYNTVGEKYNWRLRRNLSDAELAIVIGDPLIEIYVLYVDDVPAGFAELDRHQPTDVELVQFGLMPNFVGQGLGTWFLQWTINKAWSEQTKRFWLHTCTLDHVAAVPTYQKAGFVIFREEKIRREL